MKSQWQQFQQQQRQRMQQGVTWMEQQKRMQQQATGQLGPQAKQQVDQHFSQVEQEAARLRQQFTAGKLSQEALEAKLRELVIQDTAGTWWMVGTESGRWYRYDGQDWMPDMPPTRGLGGIGSMVSSTPHTSGGGSIVKAFFVFIFGLVLSGGLFTFGGWASYNLIYPIDYDLADSASYLFAGLTGLIGLVITWRKARKVAREY